MERGVRPHLVEPRRCALETQQRFRRHQDQWLADVAPELPPQNVEIVGRRGRDRDLHVVLGTHLQKAFEPRRGVLGPLALVAVRQEAHQPRHAQPLAFARGDELVDHYLCSVGEVAELRLP